MFPSNFWNGVQTRDYEPLYNKGQLTEATNALCNITEPHLRLIGLGVVIIGFLLIVAAQFVFVNAILGMLALRNMMPLAFALFFMDLDTSPALFTLVIWFRETD